MIPTEHIYAPCIAGRTGDSNTPNSLFLNHTFARIFLIRELELASGKFMAERGKIEIFFYEKETSFDRERVP